MSDIILTNGQPANPTPERPTNERILAFVKEDQARKEAEALSEKIVALGNADTNPEIVERRRKQALAAFSITLQQLDADAQTLEAAATVGDLRIQEVHQNFDTARCLRVTMTWLQGLMGVAGGEKTDEPGS